MRRLYILSVEEPLFHPELFDTILKSRADSWDVVGGALVPHRKPLVHSAMQLLRMAGASGLLKFSGRLVRRRLRSAVRRARPGSVHGILRRHGVRVERAASPNDQDLVSRIARLEPDVIFCAVPHILKQPILGVPRLACVNRHAGRLPDYRGVEPVFQALRAGAEHVWVTYHTMTPAIDAGTVLWEHPEPVRPGDSVFELYERLFAAAGEGFWPAMATLERGGGRPVDISRGRYFSWPSNAERTDFRRRGLRYI